MKKIMMTLVALVMAISANAQYLNDFYLRCCS